MLELRPPNRALALRRGRTDCQVASCSLHSLLVLGDDRPHNPAVLPVRPAAYHGPRACDRQRRSSRGYLGLIHSGVKPPRATLGWAPASLGDFPYLAGLHFAEHLQQGWNEREKIWKSVREWRSTTRATGRSSSRC